MNNEKFGVVFRDTKLLFYLMNTLPVFSLFLLIAFRHSATSAMIETIEVVELLLILLLQLWTHHSGSIADALHNHNLTDAVVLCLEETVVWQREIVVEVL